MPRQQKHSEDIILEDQLRRGGGDYCFGWGIKTFHTVRRNIRTTSTVLIKLICQSESLNLVTVILSCTDRQGHIINDVFLLSWVISVCSECLDIHMEQHKCVLTANLANTQSSFRHNPANLPLILRPLCVRVCVCVWRTVSSSAYHTFLHKVHPAIRARAASCFIHWLNNLNIILIFFFDNGELQSLKKGFQSVVKAREPLKTLADWPACDPALTKSNAALCVRLVWERAI